MADIEEIDMAGLHQQLGFVLRLAQVAVFKDLTACLKPFRLRPADFSVLLIVEANPGLKQQSIGEALSIQGPNLVAMIDRLQERGLLARGAVASDRRAHAVRLTQAGAKLLADSKRAHARHLARVGERLGGGDQNDLIAALWRLSSL